MNNTETLIFIILMVLNAAYLTYAISFSSRRPLKKFYHKLLLPNVFALHFSAAGLLAIAGLYLARKQHELYTVLFGPMIFLVVLFLCNQVTRVLYGRNIIFVFRGDTKPKEYVWYVDGLFGFCCLFVSFVLPAYLSVFFKSYHEVKIGITNG